MKRDYFVDKKLKNSSAEYSFLYLNLTKTTYFYVEFASIISIGTLQKPYAWLIQILYKNARYFFLLKKSPKIWQKKKYNYNKVYDFIF